MWSNGAQCEHVAVLRGFGSPECEGMVRGERGEGGPLSLDHLGTKQAYQLHWSHLENIIYQLTHDRTDSY